jgi:3'-5' exoribonuclease 1
MHIENDFYLVIDVEATCSDDGSVPRNEMEIIEIGAVMADSRTLQAVSEFQTFISPVRNPELTPFCTQLTGITQDNLREAPEFSRGLVEMQNWMDKFGDFLFCSWGDYDRSQFMRDCEFHRVDYPFSSGHLNLKAEFSNIFSLRKKLGVVEAH